MTTPVITNDARAELNNALQIIEGGRLGAELFSLNSSEIHGVREKIVAAQIKIARDRRTLSLIETDVEIEFVEWRANPKSTYSPDAALRVVGQPDCPLILVRDPHYEGGSGDDGLGVSYCDEGWDWEDGAELTKGERDLVSDWVKDLVREALDR